MKINQNFTNVLRTFLIVSVFSFTAFTGLSAQETESNANQSKTETVEIKPVIDTSTFSLVNTSASSQKLQLKGQTLTVTPKPQIKTDASQFFQKQLNRDKFETALFNTSLVALLALNVADYFSTVEALKHEGLSEGNPIMKPFVKNSLVFAGVKIAMSLGNHYFMKKLHKRNKTMAWILTAAANFGMSYIVANNIRLINSVGN